MIFTWTMLCARSKGLLDRGDIYASILVCSVVIDACLLTIALLALI